MWLPYAAAAKSLQSCPTLCDPIDGGPPDSPIPGILEKAKECQKNICVIDYAKAFVWITTNCGIFLERLE